MPDWETVRDFALGYPEAEEDASRQAIRVRGKLFVWMSPHERGALCVRVDPEEKDFLIASNPRVYFSTPHYDGYPAVLIRLERIGRRALGERIEDAWLLRAPKRLVADLAALSEARGTKATTPERAPSSRVGGRARPARPSGRDR